MSEVITGQIYRLNPWRASSGVDYLARFCLVLHVDNHRAAARIIFLDAGTSDLYQTGDVVLVGSHWLTDEWHLVM